MRASKPSSEIHVKVFQPSRAHSVAALALFFFPFAAMAAVVVVQTSALAWAAQALAWLQTTPDPQVLLAAASLANAPALLLPEIKAAIEQVTEGVGKLKSDHAATTAELTRQIERIELRQNRYGLAPVSSYTAPGLSDNASTGSASWTKDGEPVKVLHGPGEIRSHYAACAGDGPELKMSDFMRAVANLGASPEARAVVSVGTDADGGFAVPSRLMGEVLAALVPESAVMQAGAGILPLEDFGAKGFTLAAVDTIPQAAWRAENGNVFESSPGFRAVQMTPRSLSFYFKVSREWLADAVGVEQVLTTAIAQAFAKELDRAALLGTGTAPEPRGVAATAGIIAVGNGANGASLATAKFANFLAAVQQLLEANAPMPTAAIMSPRSRVVLAGLADTTGQPLMRPEMLDSLRMLTTSQVPNNLTVGSSTDCSQIYLGEFGRMVYAMRERMSIQRLDELFATSGQVAFVGHVRADVGVMYPKAFAVVSGVRP
jgi:HK97 family phage major capsid protein